jgi:hypothetical protein
MAHPFHHAVSSARKFGGVPADYQAIHDWFDVIWTVKPFSDHSSTEPVVPVVHRRGGACGLPGRPWSRVYIGVVPTRPIPKLSVKLHCWLLGAR